MRVLILFFVWNLAAIFSTAQVVSYDLSSVPDSLKSKASVVTQYSSEVLKIDNVEKAVYTVHKVFTVVGTEGKSSQLISFYTNKFVGLEEVDIKVYDKAGIQIGKHKKKDLVMQSSGEGLVEEGVYYYLDVAAPSYPITIDYTYSTRYKGTLLLPAYQIIRPGESVLKSSFQVILPTDLGLRFHARNFDIKPKTEVSGSTSSFIWTVSNQPPFPYEEGAVEASDRYPTVRLALNKFSHYGVDGNLSSWQSFGQWLAKLYEGQDKLSGERTEFFKDLVKSASTDAEKARIIYKYLQENFRYVSIQLGIGGFKPFSAEFTDAKKYGDCKGLSNYMKAALNVVGVKSHIAIINSNYNALPVDPSFPTQDFNHVILCIPQPKDSIWLECTSSTQAFGELGTFTENRNALLLTDKGGVLVPTPKSEASANQFVVSSRIGLNADGSGLVQSLIRYSGQYQEMMDYISKEKRDDQKESIVFSLGYKQPDDFSLSKSENMIDLKLQIDKIPEFNAGNKVFLALHPYPVWSRQLPKAEGRSLDYYFRNPFIYEDTTTYVLPEGYLVETLPKSIDSKHALAQFQFKSWYEESTREVKTVTRLVLTQHRIPVSEYAGVKTFFDDVLKAEKQRIIVKKP